MNFKNFKLTPRHEQKEHLYRCTKCTEETWFIVKLPDHMLSGHHQRNLNWCTGLLVWKAERVRYPDFLKLCGIDGLCCEQHGQRGADCSCGCHIRVSREEATG